MKKKSLLLIIVLSGLMGLVEVFIAKSYMEKALYKLVIFLVLPLLLNVKYDYINFERLFTINKKKLARYFILGLLVFILIVLGYMVFGSLIEFDQVGLKLEENMGVKKKNFLGVALYIALVNSFLEEFIFRGLGYLNLGKNKSWGWEGALIFALYHMAIMRGWFNPLIFLLALAGLFLAGLFFNLLDSKSDNLYLSYLVHMFANLAINYIAYFYILN